MSTQDEAQVVDEMLDVPPEFRSVAAQYGREMYLQVLCVGMATQAAGQLGALLERRQSRAGLELLGSLISCFNQMSLANGSRQGWTPEMLAQCDRDLQRAFARKIQVAKNCLILPNSH